jgi:hypothetical protein
MNARVGYPWRVPDEETTGLYPGLVVHDGRQSGSITAGPSRLPLWALTGDLPNGWESVEANYEPSRYYWGEDEMFGLIHDVLQLRGDFARLLLILANGERCDREQDMDGPPWWRTPFHRDRVRDALRQALAALDREEPAL